MVSRYESDRIKREYAIKFSKLYFLSLVLLWIVFIHFYFNSPIYEEVTDYPKYSFVSSLRFSIKQDLSIVKLNEYYVLEYKGLNLKGNNRCVLKGTKFIITSVIIDHNIFNGHYILLADFVCVDGTIIRNVDVSKFASIFPQSYNMYSYSKNSHVVEVQIIN